ncbi:DUF4132 domain-containing protein [Capnocytophaga gingivalis]|mgnify:FL=1|uniref:DUF4132 domain-containing protein n=2 Tax=Capnocytophaga gingivalis TaxID=1017 RepID=UPI0023F83C2C|nr:DUF4132 domain-containing protein [Capnocytophaga gingivalis]
MIKQEQAEKFLAKYEPKELKEADLAFFSAPYQQLGAYITGLMEYEEIGAFEQEFDSYNFPDKLWESKEGKALALLLFGKEIAPYAQRVWDSLLAYPYLRWWGRRPFRSENPADYTEVQLSKMSTLYNYYGSGVGALPIAEQFQYVVYREYNVEEFFALVLSENPDAYYELFKDIFSSEHEIGGVCTVLIKAALITQDTRYRTLVEKLLLAAQLQEGLRQTILESLDGTSLASLQHFIGVILQHNLTRFSSVVRAVDVWFGFGWEAPQQSVIKRTLELAQTFLADHTAAEKTVSSKDNIERYVALWAVGGHSVQQAISLAVKVIQDPQTSHEGRIVTLYFVRETGRTDWEIATYAENHFGEAADLDYWLLQNLPEGSLSPVLFDRMQAVAKALPKEGKHFEGVGFRWLSFTLKSQDIYRFLIGEANEEQQERLAGELSEIPVEVRQNLLQNVYPVLGRGRYYYESPTEKKKKPEKYPADSWQRALVRTALNDKASYVAEIAFEILKKVPLVQDDILAIEQVLSRKNKEQRKESVALLIKQPEAVLKDSTSRLIVSKSADQRLAALEILTVLQEEERLTDYVTEQVEAYKGRKLTKNEQVLMDKLAYNPDETGEQRYDLSNGFGVIDFDRLTPFALPQPQFDKERKEKKGFLFDKIIRVEKVREALNDLLALWRKNKDYEYACEWYQGETRTLLLGQQIYRMHATKEGETPMEVLEDYPLAVLWKDWHQKHQLNEIEYQYAIRYCQNLYYENKVPKQLKDYLAGYYPDFKVAFKGDLGNYYDSEARRLEDLLIPISEAYAQDKAFLASFKLSVFEDVLATYPPEKRHITIEHDYEDLSWTDVIRDYIISIDQDEEGDMDYYTPEQRFKLWQLLYYTYAQKQTKDDLSSYTPQSVLTGLRAKVREDERLPGIGGSLMELTLTLYQKGQLSADDLLFFCLLEDELFTVAQGGENYFYRRLPEALRTSLTFPDTQLELLKTRMLQMELQRGDLPTDASIYIQYLQEVEGMHYFFEALERMGKEPFAKGYYYGNDLTKRRTFSHILEVSQPSATDTFAAFKAHLDKTKITDKRLVEVACYALHWVDWIGEYLQIKDFKEAIWWFIAHTTDYMDAEKETIVSQYSSVPRDDFQRGAIDVDWYHRVHKAVGKEGWKLIQESAKYLSDGMGYRRVKLYSAVLTGEIKLSEVIQKITEKRDKDYVMALGLVPINKKKEEEDLVSRYNLLQTFLKESKQFGQQRQESEKNAVEIGLDNLSRNAGYEDSIRFSWAMEAKATQQIMEKSTLVIDDTQLQLVVDEEGKAELEVTKGDKTLKSIPDKYKKDKQVEVLKDNKSYLTKQYSRTRLSLEQAMLSQTLFTVAELHRIMEHPVVKAMLSKLVLFNPENQDSGFWQDGKLLNAEGTLTPLKADDKLLIAHPSHLFYAVQWDLYQKYLFDKELKQPFKQVFRELYIPTKDELETSNRSERYQGHQVQPQKTVVLLRSRGWTVNYEEGLQRVYHKEGFRATIYAAADWYTPSDVEAPTLEYVVFYSLKDGKEVPMKDINPVIFSEVMRDVDLVVSVAHVGGVDPEASHSTMQMRAALARESARLFKLSNVEVKERHILVKGKLGEYSIHLGSGMVSRGGLQLSILAVQSQHRGRVFLPFVDDDPKSAEIISKMRLLAEDDKIKDPTILRQIK